MMKKSLKKKWVAALTDGSYKQGERYLRTNDTFCCLGVLCDLYAHENKNGEWVGEGFVVEGAVEIDAENDPFNKWVLDGSTMPPLAVMQWAGIDVDDARMLAAHNDSRWAPGFLGHRASHPFSDIATLIHDYL